jgi:hypothetical protein
MAGYKSSRLILPTSARGIGNDVSLFQSVS